MLGGGSEVGVNEQEQNELLVRLDTRQASIETRLEKIEAKLSDRRCYTHAEKIRTLEKITWGALLAAMIAMIKSFWGVIIK